jgi:hypothetical protein
MGHREVVIAGLVLMVVGVGLGIVGYEMLQPTMADQAVSALESLSRTKAPPGLKSDHTSAYLLLGLGGIAVLGGVVLVLRPDASSPTAGRRD